MVSKYCPKCGAELEVRHKCPGCKYIGPALYGKNNATLKEVKEMEEKMSNQERLIKAKEEMIVIEEKLCKLEPIRKRYVEERDVLEKLVKDAMFKINRIKEIYKEINNVANGSDGDLWNEINSECFSPADCVILEYAGKDWGVRLLQWFAGCEKK